uniref:mitogen-activated protein kinase kinase n=1 Tax=Aceria tosichella TaxID=561515 RepID=A0A6G1SD55_9ACAR
MSNLTNKKRPPKLSFTDQSAIAPSGVGLQYSELGQQQDAIPVGTQDQAANVAGSTSDSHNLDSSVRVRFDGHDDILISPSSLTVTKQLGRGQYGVVEEVRHEGSGFRLAVKRVALRPGDDNERTRLLMDVDILVKSTECKNIIKFYGALLWEGDLWVLMELMDCSLYKFYRLAHRKAETPVNNATDARKQFKTTPLGPCTHVGDNVELGNCDLCNPIPERVLGRMAADIVNALSYLYSIKVIHRDVKPSNILINRIGIIKLCDFGISGYLVNSVARTYEAGCRPYMAPERIDPPRDRTGYDIKSDVWSFGITMLEIATGRYPYQNARDFFEQLKSICTDEPPKLTKGRFTATFEDFIGQCLRKDYQTRPKYDSIETHPFILSNRNLDISEFTEKVLSNEVKA